MMEQWRNVVVVALLCTGIISNGCTITDNDQRDIPDDAPRAFTCSVDGREWIAYIPQPLFCDTGCPQTLYWRFGNIWGPTFWISANSVRQPQVIEFQCQGVRDTGRYQFDYVHIGGDTLIDRDSSWLTISEIDSADSKTSIGFQEYRIRGTFQIKLYCQAEQRWMYITNGQFGVASVKWD